jgi:signal transduction histidine kinase
VEQEVSDVNFLVQRVVKLLYKQLEENNIQIHENLDLEIPPVYVMANQIQQVFFNIILNAMDAMPEGGDIFIESTRYDGQVEIIFEDTGPGVPAESSEQIFEPFMSTRENGTGLGLSVSYNIVDAHQGSLDLLTDRDRGACFRIRLPILERT